MYALLDHHILKLLTCGSIQRIVNSQMRADTNYLVVESILSRRDELFALCERVHKLEALISRVQQDVNIIETQVIEAEQDIKSNSEGKLRSMLRPLLFVSKKIELGHNKSYNFK